MPRRSAHLRTTKRVRLSDEQAAALFAPILARLCRVGLSSATDGARMCTPAPLARSGVRRRIQKRPVVITPIGRATLRRRTQPNQVSA